MIGGIDLVFTAGFAIWFGSLVDHHRKKRIMLASSAGSFVLHAGSLAAYMLAPEGALARVEGAPLWGFILLVMLAVICGNIRMIALPTLVTALVEEGRRDKANGLVGMRSEAHTSELTSLMRLTHAVLCLIKERTQRTTVR